MNSMTNEIGKNFLLFKTAEEIWDAAHGTFSKIDNTQKLFALECILHNLQQGELAAARLVWGTKVELSWRWAPLPANCGQKRLYKFLLGLNRELDDVHGMIMRIKPIPSITRPLLKYVGKPEESNVRMFLFLTPPRVVPNVWHFPYFVGETSTNLLMIKLQPKIYDHIMLTVRISFIPSVCSQVSVIVIRLPEPRGLSVESSTNNRHFLMVFLLLTAALSTPPDIWCQIVARFLISLIIELTIFVACTSSWRGLDEWNEGERLDRQKRRVAPLEPGKVNPLPIFDSRKLGALCSRITHNAEGNWELGKAPQLLLWLWHIRHFLNVGLLPLPKDGPWILWTLEIVEKSGYLSYLLALPNESWLDPVFHISSQKIPWW